MQASTIELFSPSKQRWVKVPALNVEGRNLITSGTWLKTAALQAEAFLERGLEDPSSCIALLKQRDRHGFHADLLTFAQKLPDTSPRYDYPMEWESVAAIRLSSFQDWWQQLPQETRKNTRRAAKRGVVITTPSLDDKIIAGIVAINNETPIRQGRRFPHYGTNFEEVNRDFQSFPERSELVCAYAAEELIGLVKIIYCGEVGTIAKLQSKVAHYDSRPSNALLAKAIEICAQRGMKYVTYGNYRYGNQPHTSLMTFKDRHGFGEVLLPRYYVPLTMKGAVALRLGVHRELRALLPRSVLSTARSVRSRWYSVK